MDDSELRRLIEVAYPRLVAGLALISGSRAAAEDVVQEALARWWEHTARGRTIENPEAWMTTVAMNLARSRRRRILAERRARDRMPPGDPPTPPGPDAVDVRRALAGLPRREREAVVLHYYFDLPVSAVADLQRVAEGTVKTSLHRARKSLARSLGEPQWADEEVEHERR